MKKLILYLFFTFLFLIPFDTFASSVNVNTSYIFDVNDEDFSFQYFQDATYQDILDYFTSLESEYYNISVLYDIHGGNNYMTVILYPKNETQIYTNASSIGILNLYPTNTSIHKSLTLFGSLNSNFFGSTDYNNINNCIVNNTNCWTRSLSHGVGVDYKNNSLDSISIIVPQSSLTIDDNDSINYLDFYYHIDNYFYYSNVPQFISYSSTTLSNGYTKKLIINGIELSSGDNYPTYLDLFSSNDVPLLAYNSLQPFLIGGIDKNNISNFKFNLGFNYVSKEYIESVRPYFYYFGRVDNGTYYSYQQLNCNGLGYSYSFDTDNNYVNASYLYNGFSCIDDLTNIDKIYIRTDFNYDTTNNYNTYVYNLTYTVNGGYGKFFNYSSYITPYGYTIYEKFDNLDDSYSILTSTNQESSTVQYFSNNNNTVYVNVNRDTLKVGQVSYNPLTFGSLYNTNGMIFNYPNNDNIDTTIELLFKSDVILSFKTIVDNHDTYTYYDNNNSLTTNTIDNNVIISFDDSYNTDYYNNIVSNYIDGLRDSIIEFSNLTQQFYNKLPDVFKTFIYVIFIMFCFYFTYLIIKR